MAKTSTPKSISDLKDQINKKYDEGTIRTLGDLPMQVPVQSTSITALDVALCVGGLPRGRIVEMYGPEMSGKSTLALHVVAQAQSEGLVCAYIDAENALDPTLAASLGVQVDDLLLTQPSSGEQAFDVLLDMVESGLVSVIVVDSVAALVPQAELDGDMEDLQIGAQARLMSKGLRKLTSAVSETGAIVIFINQLREKIGGYGNPETTPGGRSLKFYSSVRLDVRGATASSRIKDGKNIKGHRITVKVVKNKVATPFKQCEFDLIYGEGVDKASSLLAAAKSLSLVETRGSWLYYNEERYQGDNAMETALRENKALYDEINGKIKQHLLKNMQLADHSAEDEPEPSEAELLEPMTTAEYEQDAAMVDQQVEAAVVSEPEPPTSEVAPAPGAVATSEAASEPVTAPKPKPAGGPTLTERITGFLSENTGKTFPANAIIQGIGGGNPGAVATILRNLTEQGAVTMVEGSDPKEFRAAEAV